MVFGHAVQGPVWKTGRAGPGKRGSGPPTISAQTPYSSPYFEPTNCCTHYQKTFAHDYPFPPPIKLLQSMVRQGSLPYSIFCAVIPPRAPKGLLPDSLHNYETMANYASKTRDKVQKRGQNNVLMYKLQVTDMDVVFEVIGQLESFQISREELEVNFLDISYYENEKKSVYINPCPGCQRKTFTFLLHTSFFILKEF